MILVTNPHDTVESVNDAIKPSATDMNGVHDLMVVEYLEVFWGGQYPNLNVELKRAQFGMEHQDAFSIMMEHAAENSRMKYSPSFQDKTKNTVQLSPILTMKQKQHAEIPPSTKMYLHISSSLNMIFQHQSLQIRSGMLNV